MNPYTVTTTQLKHKTGEILDLVVMGHKPVTIKRHGKIIARLTPATHLSGTADFPTILKKFSGSIPDFPDPTLDRTANTRRFSSQL